MRRSEGPRGDRSTRIFSQPPADSRLSSARSKTSLKSGHSNANVVSSGDSDDDAALRTRPSRRHSAHAKSEPTIKTPSRPTSRASRNRSDSTGTSGGTAEKEKTGKRLSVTGWATSAVGSVTGRGKKSRDKFSALKDDEGEQEVEGEGEEAKRPPSSLSFSSKKSSKTRSKESLKGASPKFTARILKPPSLQDKKIVRALYDFSGSTDELSFKAGDEIMVVNEVLDGWWMGELDNRKGLFPTAYTEIILSLQPKPLLPHRYSSNKVGQKLGSSLSSEDDSSKQTLVNGDGYGTSDIDEEHAVAEQHLVPAQSPFYGFSDVVSVTSSVASEEEEKQHLMPVKNSAAQPHGRTTLQPLNTQSTSMPTRSATDIHTGSGTSTPVRKAPPPPPPRRSTTNALTNSPRIPERTSSAFRSQSSGSLPKPNLTPPSSISSQGYDTSPFESAIDFAPGECQDFHQNPFKPRGMCSNCFDKHT